MVDILSDKFMKQRQKASEEIEKAINMCGKPNESAEVMNDRVVVASAFIQFTAQQGATIEDNIHNSLLAVGILEEAKNKFIQKPHIVTLKEIFGD